ncbi:MAG: 5'/3'-nucleotidase SurE [Betaproteobacteria bacterium]|jgi:5'-nucleotidase|nr:5'/3'-nucleotidase SurE [Betaproteobacteria bacterium]
MRILVSNDDGYFSPGIAALAQAMRAFGEVTVVAPEADRSGASNSLTLDRPLYVRRSSQGFYYVNGTPTDCVHVAVTGFLDHRPDLVVSGINNSANLAEDTLYSGTVAAAMEGYLLGLPAIAFSLASRSFEHLETAVVVAQQVVRRLVDQPFTKARLLNVNIPAVSVDELQGYELTRLGRRHVAQPVETAVSPRGETVYWVGPPGGQREAGPGTDFHALNQSRVSVTPLQVDLGDLDGFQEVGPWLEKM